MPSWRADTRIQPTAFARKIAGFLRSFAFASLGGG